jgi:hypothetical protein
LHARRCGEALKIESEITTNEDEVAASAFDAAYRDAQSIHFDEIGRLFGLALALRSVRQDLHDLAERIKESQVPP